MKSTKSPEEVLADYLYKTPRTISQMAKKLKTKHSKSVYRVLHRLHEGGFDVVRRGFEATDDITYSIQKIPRGAHAPR